MKTITTSNLNVEEPLTKDIKKPGYAMIPGFLLQGGRGNHPEKLKAVCQMGMTG